MIGPLWVPAGKTLSIPAGTTLRFYENGPLMVDGTLNVAGVGGSPVTFTSERTAPASNDWPGIQIRSTATGVVLDNALIEWADRGIDVQNGNVIVRHSRIQRFATAGISMTGAGAQSEIIDNDIDNFVKTGDGIWLNGHRPPSQRTASLARTAVSI